MKSEFDTEIDRLLRRDARGERVNTALRADAHLDADMMNAYVERALPPNLFAAHTEHLLGCDVCRARISTLARVLTDAAREDDAEPAIQATLAATPDIPKAQARAAWWSSFAQLFGAPGMAYALPTFALVALGVVLLIFIARDGREASSIADLTSPTNNIPSAANMNMTSNTNMMGNMNTATANMNAETATLRESIVNTNQKNEEANLLVANANANYSAAAPVAARQAQNESPTEARRMVIPPDVKMDVTPSASAPSLLQPSTSELQRQLPINNHAAPPPPPATAPQQTTGATTARRAMKESGEVAAQQIPPSATDTAKPAPLEERNADELAASPRARGATVHRAERSAGGAPRDKSAPREVGGRRFVQRGGVWVDAAYAGGTALTNVRRESELFRTLVADDPALRRIAEALPGEVIVISKGRAYRIR